MIRLSTTPLFSVTLGGKERTKDVVEDVMGIIVNAAVKSTHESAEFHTETAKDKVHQAYTTAEFPKISFMYAKWLVELRSSALGKSLSDEEIEKQAKELITEKQSMILTGGLVNGINFEPVVIDNNTITSKLKSDSEYSGDHEKGFLFGKLRPGKQRPFFTGHVYLTEESLRNNFNAHLSGET